jgi:type I restriction enzyme S subunit
MTLAFNAPAGWAVPCDIATIDALVAKLLETPVDDKPRQWSYENSAAFGKVKELWGKLSNMANGIGFTDPATGLKWKSSEAWYQARRFPEDAKHQEAIRNAGHAYASKEVAYEKISESQSDWNAVKVKIMARALVLKATNPDFVDALNETGDMNIVEKSWRDSFYGAKPIDCPTKGPGKGGYIGANVLGQLETRLRDAIGEMIAKGVGADEVKRPRSLFEALK